jgi:hypothetical protein
MTRQVEPLPKFVVGYDRLGRPRRRTPTLALFMAKVAVVDSGCWEWQAARDVNGYGVFHDEGCRRVLAHRWAYGQWWGQPGEKYVLHSCDNPPCVNPAHLRAGTAAENSGDMVRRNRHRPMRNEESGMARLTDQQVAEIRAASADGELQRDTAQKFGVHPAHVSRIVNGKRRPR